MVGLKNMRCVRSGSQKYLHKVGKIVFQNIMHLKQFQGPQQMIFHYLPDF